MWNLRPDIVTLDRCILAQASEHSHIERVLPGLVSLLHESGQLVLMGGLTTERDALIALECNVDFVQGAYFAGPSVDAGEAASRGGAVMDALSAALRERVAARERAQSARLAPYVSGAGKRGSAHWSKANRSPRPPRRCSRLAKRRAASCSIASGRQIGDNVLPIGRASQRAKRFRPLLHSEGASWERRPYFIEAMRAPGQVHLTPPYLSINEAHLCVTASIAAQTPHGLQVLCVDINWDAAIRRH